MLTQWTLSFTTNLDLLKNTEPGNFSSAESNVLPAMSSGLIIGSRVSITASSDDTRYEGTVTQVDSEQKTVRLDTGKTDNLVLAVLMN